MINNLGIKLKNARLNSGLSRKQIAELTGVTVTTIGMCENDERLPSLSMLVKLATHYKVSTDYLLGCEIKTNDTLSLDGLTDEQIKSLKMVANCYRNLNR